MRDSCLVTTCENRRCPGRASRVLKRQSDCWPGSACGASAYRVHDQHQGASFGKETVNVGRSSRFFDAVPGQIGAHRGDQLFGVCHDLILAPTVSFVRHQDTPKR